jgi:small redox-active disulfide protein 2
MSKKIEIIGGGCPKCEKMLANSKEAVKLLNVEAEIVPVFDKMAGIQRGLSDTPALIIDGKVKCMGRVAEIEEIKKWLT